MDKLAASPFSYLQFARTGPAAEINMMGYGQARQITHGIHQRCCREDPTGFLRLQLPQQAAASSSEEAKAQDDGQ